MKINLLLCLGLALVSALHAHHIASDKNSADNTEKLSGRWHTIFLASNVRKRIEDGGDMRFFINSIDVHEHDITFDLDIQQDGKCIQYVMVAEKTEKSNVLKVDYEGENTIYVEKAEPNDHVIFFTHNIQNGSETWVLELYGRNKTVQENAKEFFKDLSEKHGINQDDIIDMTKENGCDRDGQ